ncbi:MAG: sigma-54-dependent Fis family transcriptional regulator, partial [Clostridia bacterium]|nr:sigma-54-dependent Fis family transcriptional regulator [Clostridia bacterium]
DCLMFYPWPGNVRELENTIERAVILAKKPLIEKENLFLSPPDITSLGKPGLSFGSKCLRKVERNLLATVLEETKWNLSKAAQILEISRTTLYSKIKKHGLAK